MVSKATKLLLPSRVVICVIICAVVVLKASTFVAWFKGCGPAVTAGDSRLKRTGFESNCGSNLGRKRK